MPRGRPKNLSNYEKVKAKKIRDFLFSQNINRFDRMSDSALLKSIRISEDRVFISLGYHDDILKKISKFVDELKAL